MEGGREQASVVSLGGERMSSVRYSVASMPKDKSSAFGVWVGKGERRREEVKRDEEEDRTFI